MWFELNFMFGITLIPCQSQSLILFTCLLKSSTLVIKFEGIQIELNRMLV